MKVNGKMRGTVEVAVGIDQAGAVAAAMELANVKKLTEVRIERGTCMPLSLGSRSCNVDPVQPQGAGVGRVIMWQLHSICQGCNRAYCAECVSSGSTGVGIW